MTLNHWMPYESSASKQNVGELLTDYRARLAHDRLQATERRQQEIAEQSSALNTPDVRIRIWERVHGLGLPRDSTHSIVAVVAAATHLTIEQVIEEQRQRSAAATRKARTTALDATPAPTLEKS